jgi:hypothetical protein
MSSGTRIRPAARRAIAAGLVAGLAASCTPGGDSPVPRADLLSPANGPRLFVERGEISPAAPVFSGGFLAAEVPEREAPSRWLGDEPGQITVSMVGLEPRPRRLGLEMRASADSSVTIHLGFDGEPLGVIDQGPYWSRHLLELPAERCGVGEHVLELDPQGASTASGAEGGRALSVRIRRVWLEPATTASGEPQLGKRGLELPPGTGASWAFWVPPGASLQASWEGGEGLEGVTPFILLSDDGPPRPLDTLDLGPLGGEPMHLAAVVPASATGPLRLRHLVLAQSPSSTPGPAPAARPGKSLLVVGELSEGFPITPCTTDRERALRCLLSGQEEAAFGLLAEPVFDHVGYEPDAVAAFLAAAPAPATAALVVPAEGARIHAERIRRRVGGLEVLMADLPRSPDDLTVLAAALDAGRPPINARDVDLAPTALAAAGVDAPHLDGLDLRPALLRSVTAPVRPVAPVWLEDRSVAVTRGARFELRIGESRVPRSTLEACALDYLRRRRDTLRWVDGARIVRPKGAGH